jgi:hypothetical protein
MIPPLIIFEGAALLQSSIADAVQMRKGGSRIRRLSRVAG